MPGNFLDYARSKAIGLADPSTIAGAGKLCEDYLDHVEAFTDGLVPLIDVKFNSWNAIGPFWASPHQEPIFMQALNARAAAFLFVRRRDLAAQILSEKLARRTGTWHGIADHALPGRMTVPIGKVREQARHIVQAEKFFAGFLARYPLCRNVVYEEMFHDDVVDPGLADFCFSAVGLPAGESLRAAIPKNAGDKAALIANYAEAVEEFETVCRNFRRTPF